MKFELSDLHPQSCSIELIVNKEPRTYALKKMSLLVMIWIKREWGSEDNWAGALDPESEVNKKTAGVAHIEALCKTIHHLLEDKTDFPKWEDFAECVGVGPNELANISRALMVVQGASMPDIDRVIGDATAKAKKKIETMMAKKKPRAGKK